MKITVTSQNFCSITGHAGKSHRVIIYETNNQDIPLEVDHLDLPKEIINLTGINHHAL
jgi:hypothetical protein